MEIDKRKLKKKRVITEEKEEEESERKKKLKLKAEEEGVGSGVEPSEEEVEEFFAILRRMKVAVNYFDSKGKGGKEWREALEQTENNNLGVHRGLDLNAVAPEATDSDGA